MLEEHTDFGTDILSSPLINPEKNIFRYNSNTLRSDHTIPLSVNSVFTGPCYSCRWKDTYHRGKLINNMSTVITDSITSIKGDVITTHIVASSEIVTEGGTKTITSETLTLGLIKEYLTCYNQGQKFLDPDENTGTFNMSSIIDTSTGTFTITHVNNYNVRTIHTKYIPIL